MNLEKNPSENISLLHEAYKQRKIKRHISKLRKFEKEKNLSWNYDRMLELRNNKKQDNYPTRETAHISKKTLLSRKSYSRKPTNQQKLTNNQKGLK